MEAAITSETSVNFYQCTPRNKLEDSHHHRESTKQQEGSEFFTI
jgi:hypothetical protein